MKKVGILTINDNNNYGNRLQNYALLRILKRLNFEPENILNDTKYSNLFKRKTNMFFLFIKLIILRLLQKETIKKMERKKNFLEFNDKYIKNSQNMISEKMKKNKMEEIAKDYDYFVLGSDQVWNPNFPRTSVIDFALFAPKEKVISYAASFGVSEIKDELKDFYKKGLNNVSKISVREERGKELVKELSGKEATVVLDPTLLLTQEEWEKVITKPDAVPNKKFILTYFLGNISEERNEKLQELANNNDFEIVNLGKIQYKEYYTAGPSEFLWYFKNAEMIFTDSFHACVFSIIFDKTFYIMEREQNNLQSMNSRIDTLLKTFNLPDRKFKNWENISLEHDYSHVEEILEKEKEKSLNFLKQALDIKE